MSMVASAQQPPPEPTSEPPGRRVFVPLEELQTLIQRDQKWVLLPRDEFQKLYVEARKNTLDKPVPPQAIGVGNVQYAGKIVDDQLVITATLEVTKFGPGWQMLPLDFRDLAIEKATLGDQPARLGRAADAGGQLILLLDKPGKEKLTLELSRSLVAVGSDKFAAFALSPRWPAEFVLDVPAEKHLQWNGVAVERPAANDQPAQFKLAFGGQKQIELRITDRPTLQTSEGLVFASTTLGLRAAPEEVTWQAVTSLQVFGKPLDQLQFRVPEALQIISITSPGLESWEFGPNGPENGETLLNLHYRQPFQEPRDVTIQAVLATKTGEDWQVPNLKLANVASHVTQVLLTTAPGMRLLVGEAVGVQRASGEAETKEPAAVAGMRYSAWREDFSLRFTTQSKAREISAAVVTLLDINANGLDLSSRATVETKFAPLFDASITLPAEWIVTDVLVNGARVTWESVPQEAGIHLLRVTFDSPLPVDQQAVIQLSAHRDPQGWPLEEGNVVIPLPEVRVLQTNVVEGTVVVAAERDLDVQPQELKGLAPTLLDPALAARLSYEYQDTHYSGQILVLRKPSRLSAHTVAFHRLDKETFFSHLEAHINVEGGGTRKLQVSLPETAGTSLRFELASDYARIVEQTAADPANGRRIWTLLLDQRVHGESVLYVDVSQPRPQAKEFVPPGLLVIGAERETGMIAFEAEPDQQLDLTATDAAGTALPDVDPTDLPVPTDYLFKERIVAAFSYVLPGYQLKLSERRFARVAVPTAICDHLQMVSILGETGELQHEATFRLRAVGVQSLQVVLPENAQLWATLLDEAPIEVRQTKTAYLIPLAAAVGTQVEAGADPSRTRTLKLFYQTEVPTLRSFGTLQQTPPGITVLNGDGSEQPLEILQQQWTIHHPDQTEFVSDPGSFVANEHYIRVSFLGDLLHSFQVDSPKNLFWKLVTLAITIGVVWIIGYLFRQSGAWGLLRLVLIVGGVGLVLMFFMLPAVQQAREAARRSQLRNEMKQLGYAAPTADFDEVTSAPATAATPMAPPTAQPAPAAIEAPAEAKSEAKPEDRPLVAAMDDLKQSEKAPTEELAKQLGDATKDAGPLARKGFFSKNQLDSDSMRSGLAARKLQSGKEAGESDSRTDHFREERGAVTERGRNARDLNDLALPAGVQQRQEVAQAQDPFAPREGAPLPPAKPAAADAGFLELSGKAVLSLALNLEPPANSRTTSYTYRGRLRQTPPELVVTYQNRAKLSFVMLVVQVLMILVCWFARQRTLALRGLILALGIGVPLGLMTIVPEAALPFLDGILCGTLLGVVLWMIIAVCQWFTPQKLWAQLNKPLGKSTPALIALCWCLCASTSQAQEPQAKIAAPAPPTRTPLIDADTLVIPYDAEDPLQSNRVFLPYNKFIELWKQAHPDEPDTTESPVAGTIAAALYAAELAPAAAGSKPAIKLTARYVCYSFREGQVTLPFPVGPVAVSNAQLDGAAAPLVPGNAQQPLAILLSKPGLHVVDLQFSVPAQLTGPAGVFNLDLGAVPSGTVRFKVPAADLNFRVNGSSGAFRRVGEGPDAALIIPISAGGQVQISWQPKQVRGDVEAIVHVESTTAVLLAEGGTRLLSHSNFQVRQGSVSEAVFSLPEALSVRKIEGQDVGGWEVAGEGENRQLKIFLRRKVDNATQLKFDLFLKQPADDLETTYVIPQFAPQNITRETGTIGVLADKQFAIRVGNLAGLSQIEPQQVPLARFETEFTLPIVLGYRFATRPWQLDLVVTRRQPQLKVTARHHAHVDPRKVQQQNRFQFRLTGAPRAGVSVLLPQGYLLQTVRAPEIKDWHVSGREDAADMDAEALLHLEFATPRVGNFDVVLVGKTLRQPNDLKTEVSLPYPLETDELDTQLLTTFDPIYSGVAGTLDNWKSIDPTNLVKELLGDVALANQLGFSSDTPAPAPVPFDLEQAAPRLSGHALTLLTVNEESLDYLFALQWNINTAGADTFIFTTPDWLAAKLDFPDGNGSRRRGITQEAIDGGRTRWTITLEDPRRDGYFIVGRAVLPPSAQGNITAPNFIFEQQQPGQDPPQILPLESQTNYVVLVNQSQTQLTSNAGEAVETIPAEDLTRVIKIRQDLIDQAAEIVRVRNPQAAITWKQQRFQAEAQLPAAVNLAHHVTVLTQDGSWREQVIYRLKNRKRQFLAVKLPPDSQVLSLFVKGQAARPVLPPKELGFTLIPLPKTVEGDVSFEVQLVLAGQLPVGPLPRRFGLVRTPVEVPIPSVVSPEENAEYGIPVAQTTWTVYAPRDLDVDVLKRSALTNVTEVSETVQRIDQTTSILTDVSELIAVNSGTFNRRAKAQSLSNLKQLNIQLNDIANTSVAVRSSEEASKQQDLQQRATRLKESIDKLIVSNSAMGLTVQDDGAGNSIVVDQQAVKSDQNERLQQLYSDNGVVITPNATTSNPMPNEPKAAEDSVGKGNLNRAKLQGLNQSQVQELAAEQQKKSGQQFEFDGEPQPQAASKSRSYAFQGQNAGLGQAAQGQQSVDGASSTTIRGLPQLGTFAGSQRQLQGAFGRPGMAGAAAMPGGQPPGGAPAVGGAMPGAMGGFGGMGGGLGGGGQFPPGPQALPSPVWTSSGGLSLLIDIPTDGNVYNFSKVNGGARLTLGLRPHETWQRAFGLIWTAIWILMLVLVGFALSRPAAVSVLRREIPWFIAALGAAIYFLVGSEYDWGMWGLIAFVIGALWIAVRRPVKL